MRLVMPFEDVLVTDISEQDRCVLQNRIRFLFRLPLYSLLEVLIDEQADELWSFAMIVYERRESFNDAGFHFRLVVKGFSEDIIVFGFEVKDQLDPFQSCL